MRARWGGVREACTRPVGGYPPRFGVEGCGKGGGRSSGVKGQGGGGTGRVEGVVGTRQRRCWRVPAKIWGGHYPLAGTHNFVKF